jgi:hypothetical protein
VACAFPLSISINGEGGVFPAKKTGFVKLVGAVFYLLRPGVGLLTLENHELPGINY